MNRRTHAAPSISFCTTYICVWVLRIFPPHDNNLSEFSSSHFRTNSVQVVSVKLIGIMRCGKHWGSKEQTRWKVLTSRGLYNQLDSATHRHQSFGIIIDIFQQVEITRGAVFFKFVQWGAICHSYKQTCGDELQKAFDRSSGI